MMQRTCTGGIYSSISDAAGTASNPVRVSARRFRHRRARARATDTTTETDGRWKAAGDLKILRRRRVAAGRHAYVPP
uniref:Uncharacterized protein n=1 Tax=Oryza sativa subsp. japonica TaxID=39947 RepID=Q656M3_ORYSJ|nr:hypothetical protein [Oryza sativa Japonica Group]